MELKDIFGIDIKNIESDLKENVFDIISTVDVESIPKRQVKKAFTIAQDLLKFKAGQIEILRERVPESLSTSDKQGQPDLKTIQEENVNLKKTIAKLETDKAALKTRIRDLTDDLSSCRKRLQESNTSDRDDSSDLLSDLDRKEELLKNINAKNKHIKRLLRDIESIEKKTVEQSKTIAEKERMLQRLEHELLEVTEKYSSSVDEISTLSDLLKKTAEEASYSAEVIERLEDEREKADREFKTFIDRLEEKAYAWRKILDDKEQQLESIRKKYEELYLKYPLENANEEQDVEIRRLMEAMNERDFMIKDLEDKLKLMADEMMSSTKVMNRISHERETAENHIPQNSRQCCEEFEHALKQANRRCKDLSEMLDSIEEDNVVKSKQATEAINALRAYEKGDDGLSQSIRKVTQLQQKLSSRDKQINALVTEINSFHEIAQENLMLRQKLNIPEDMVLSTSHLAAKQRSKDKMIDRLTLKLRASEEMRLQLKLDLNDLRKELKRMQSLLANVPNQESLLQPSFGEKYELKAEPIYCVNCLKTLKSAPKKDDVIKDITQEWEAKYSSVIEENENLRVGMHEILEKIREYDATSDHITIDCTILEKVLHALDARSISGWYHPAMRMQNELIALKEREQALKEQINIVEKAAIRKQDEIKLDDSIKVPDSVEKEQPESADSLPVIQESHNDFEIEKSHSLYPIIVQKDNQYEALKEKFDETSNKYREILLENGKLKNFEALYVEIKENLESSKSDITQYCAVLVEKLSTAEMNAKNLEKKYQFLREDFERIVNDTNHQRLTNAAIIADLKKQVIQKHRDSVIERRCSSSKRTSSTGYGGGDDDGVSKQYAELKIQLAYIAKHLLSENIVQIETKPFVNYGVIDDNFQLDYITAEEYKTLKDERNNLMKNVAEMKEQCQHLEKLLSVAEEQIKTQQKQLTDLTDNQVNLRHLVADLQSSSEDKFIISKSYRDLEIARDEVNKMKTKNQELERRMRDAERKLKDAEQQKELAEKKSQESDNNTLIKLEFLKKSLFIMQSKYCKFTPLHLLSDFLQAYSCLMEKQKTVNVASPIVANEIGDKLTSGTDGVMKVQAAKYEAKCKYLEEQASSLYQRVELLQTELDRARLSVAQDSEHWKTIGALFGDSKQVVAVESTEKACQCVIESIEISTNTDDADESNSFATRTIKGVEEPKSDDTIILSCPASPSIAASRLINIRSLESQLKQAMNLASMRSALLLETENRLAEAQGRFKEMEKIIESKNLLLKQEAEKCSREDKTYRKAGLVESTITSLQTLLTEKDTMLCHYQELLKTEREQHTKSCENYEKEIDVLQKNCSDLEAKIKAKSTEIVELKAKLDTVPKNAVPISPRSTADDELKQFEDSDDNFNEISDEKIEEMFFDENKHLSQEIFQGANEREPSVNGNVLHLRNQLRETNDRMLFLENRVKTKDEEIEILKEKLSLLEEREKIEAKTSPEIEQLRSLLEEKDKHINDLMETLSSFHDDQQRFINETSSYSADQVSQLGADLTRSEATNRILSTQLEALRRQVTSLTQREKQTRELANSLRNQLIKRPVVSVKTELNTRTKNEQLQKRLQRVELELEDSRKENRRLQALLEEKKSKNATDLALWDKQKRWQQNAEKLKTKLLETETSLEKTQMMLNTAKTTVNRLEKDKISLEARLRGNPSKCCRTPSCPNLFLTKYCPSESPETFTTGSECNSPTHKQLRANLSKLRDVDVNDSNSDIINALKARIESQQRRIVVLELERKGSNALTMELEKNQERFATLEAQNIRLEAKNLQLQLDIDLLRQGGEKDRLHKRIKYLEDYVLVLKEELAQAEAQKDDAGEKRSVGSSITQPEQTILSLRRIVERLRVENKNLKEGRVAFEARPDSKAGGDLVHELQNVKEKLQQKTQLLEKAKILLTRAAAKEKNLREQLTIWKRKCSELQNVPVIDEISE